MVAGKHPFECEDKELEKDEFYEHIVDNRFNYFWQAQKRRNQKKEIFSS